MADQLLEDAPLPKDENDKASPMDYAALKRLSPRQREVLRRTLKGESREDVARALDLSPNTVRVHLTAAKGKVGTFDAFGLCAWGRRVRLIR